MAFDLSIEQPKPIKKLSSRRGRSCGSEVIVPPILPCQIISHSCLASGRFHSCGRTRARSLPVAGICWAT